jgi:parvulin-like peptidyl-prolyl isomerase
MARQRRIPTPSWERDHGIGDFSGTRGQIAAVVGVIILIIAALGIGGYALLDKYELKPHRIPGSTALAVGDHSYSVGEFVSRTKMFTQQLSGTTNASIIIPAVVSQLQSESIVLQFAAEKNVSANDDEIKTQIATTMSITAADPNYDQRFQEELTTTGLTEEQYRSFATAGVLQTKLQAQFSAELPATLESVHYRQIVVADQTTADNLKAQIDAGADFGALATVNSTDTATKTAGGDAGWAPRGFLGATVENLLFSLDVNQVVVSSGKSNVAIYQLLEKDPAHPVEDSKKSTLATNAFRQWQTDKKAGLTIDNQMDFSTGNADKLKYVFDHSGLTAQ